MDLMQSFDAILFPADGRPPHVVSLMTSPASFSNPHTPAQTNAARVPHPEVHMEYIAEDPNMRAWHYLIVEALDMMNKKFANPYIIYYPVISRDGMPFPVNRTVRDIQEELTKGRRGRDDLLWRGNLVAAKFADNHFEEMMHASMADFPILKNFLATHPSPIRVTSAPGAPTPPTPPTLPPPPTPPQQHQQQQHPQHPQQQHSQHPHTRTRTRTRTRSSNSNSNSNSSNSSKSTIRQAFPLAHATCNTLSPPAATRRATNASRRLARMASP
ncbi:hypothetical protein V8E53_011167 [Lactarius tabidus]